jgi:Raf kinase inhibitor-like YbhB/YbcL family protein
MKINLISLLCIITIVYNLKNRRMQVNSPDFNNNDFIPKDFVPENSNPTLKLGNIPEGTKSLALLVEDPDAPKGTFYHWGVYNIPKTDTIETGAHPGIEVTNSWGIKHYKGPMPPKGKAHRYYFKVFALDSELDKNIQTVENLKNEIEKHKVTEGHILGYYQS